MGAQHFRDLQSTLLQRREDVDGQRNNVIAHLGALHWEGPRGDQFRAKQHASIAHLESLEEEVAIAAAAAGDVAHEIDHRLAQVKSLLKGAAHATKVVWTEAGEVASVVADGVQYFMDGAGQLVDSAGRALGALYDNTIGRL